MQKPVDFVYIDAEHSYEAMTNDLALWFPKVRAGGVIAGHDYSPEFDGVRRAVNEFASANQLKINLEPATVWWAVKE